MDIEPIPLPVIESKSTSLDPFVLVASSCSAISARLVAHPLDTIRIRVQTSPAGIPLPPFSQLIPKPRIQHLYAGLPVALSLGVPALAVYLTTYEASKRYLGTALLPTDTKPTILQQIPVFVLSGVMAEIASGAIWTPLDVLKSRLQKGESGNESRSAIRLLKKIVHEEGVKGVFRGYLVSMVVFCPYIALYWTLYETLKIKFIPAYDGISHNPVPTSSLTSAYSIPVTARYTLCSIAACAFSASLTTPIELVNSKWQTSAGKIGGVEEIVRDIWRKGGARGFTRGLGMRVAYAIPANGISMTVYESLKRWKGM